MLDKDGYFVKETPWECTERLCQWEPWQEYTCAPGCPFFDNRLDRALDVEHLIAIKEIIKKSGLAPDDPCVGIRVDHGEAGDYMTYEVNYRDGGRVIVNFDAVDQAADCVDANWTWADPMPYPCGHGCDGCHYGVPYLRCEYIPAGKEAKDGST